MATGAMSRGMVRERRISICHSTPLWDHKGLDTFATTEALSIAPLVQDRIGISPAQSHCQKIAVCKVLLWLKKKRLK